MNRFFLSSECFKNEIVTFPGDIAHQIRHVLRLGADDRVEVLDNRGNCFQVALAIDEKTQNLFGTILEKEAVKSEITPRVCLCFGLTNRDKVEWILQKGTEVGVAAFIPFTSSRTLVQTPTLSLKRIARWERIVREAAEQSERGRLPVLESARPFSTLVDDLRSQNGVKLIAWEEADKKGPKLSELLSNYKANQISLIVGPEGGFSLEEIESAMENGCQVVSLGTRILRMETAAILFPALVLYELGEI